MERKYHRLSLAEWQTLYEMNSRGKTIQEIAKALGRDRRGVAKALKRYELPWHYRERGPLYQARYAWEQSEHKRSASRKRLRLKNRFIRDFVEERLRKGWSPEVIAGRLEKEHPEYSITAETIYEWISKERPELTRYLLRVGKPRRGKPGARGRKRRDPAAPKKSIESRPDDANARRVIGHTESDLIVSGKGDACLLVMADRKSRQVRLKKLPNRKAETIKIALVGLYRDIPKYLRLTLTQDNGSEHALHLDLERETEVQVYFCHPYSAWERGTIENRNGIVRRFFPKGTDFALVSHEQIRDVEKWMNSTPMVVLDFHTPDEVHQLESENAFQRQLALAA